MVLQCIAAAATTTKTSQNLYFARFFCFSVAFPCITPMYYACNTRITTYYSLPPPAAACRRRCHLTPVGRVKGGNTTAVTKWANGEDDKRAANIDDSYCNSGLCVL